MLLNCLCSRRVIKTTECPTSLCSIWVVNLQELFSQVRDWAFISIYTCNEPFIIDPSFCGVKAFHFYNERLENIMQYTVEQSEILQNINEMIFLYKSSPSIKPLDPQCIVDLISHSDSHVHNDCGLSSFELFFQQLFIDLDPKSLK